MEKHTKAVVKYYGIAEGEYTPCFMCMRKATEIHHIEPKGIGGRDSAEYLENYIPLCRGCHNRAHDNKISKETLKKRVKTIMTLKEKHKNFFFQFMEGNKFVLPYIYHIEDENRDDTI